MKKGTDLIICSCFLKPQSYDCKLLFLHFWAVLGHLENMTLKKTRGLKSAMQMNQP